MKKLAILLLLAATPVLHALAGALIEVDMAALYWQPCTPSRTFATFGTVDQNQTNIKLATIDPDYHWGIRVGAKYTNTCSNVWVKFSGLRLWAVDRAELHGGGFRATLLPDNAIDGLSMKDLVDIDYYTIDVSSGYTWRCSRRLQADLYALFRYGFLRRQEKGSARGTADPQPIQTLRLHGRFKGPGFGMGFSSHYDIACSFSLRTNMMVGGLYGHQLYATSTVVELSDVPAGSTRLRDVHSGCIPMFDVSVALEYGRYFCDFITIAGQIGWEANHYFGAIPTPGDSSLLVGIHRQRIGFGGPFINLALRF